MSLSDLSPIGDPRDVDPGADDVFQTPPSLFDRGSHVAEGLDGLSVRVARADDVSAGTGRRGARDVDDVADPHRSRVAHDGLPGRSARDVDPASHWSRCEAREA